MLQQLRVEREEDFKSLFKRRFYQLNNEFGHLYRIDVFDKDGFGRGIHMMVVKVVKTYPETNFERASVQFQFSGTDELLSREFIQEIHLLLAANISQDLGTV